jgi:hypothetical protein
MTTRVQLRKKSGRESQGAWRQDELIDGKPPVVTLTLTLTLSNECPPSFEAQPTASIKPVSSDSHVNSSSLNDAFKAVATLFQQIIILLNGAESEENRILAIEKIVLKLVKHHGY